MATLPANLDEFIAYNEGDAGLNEDTYLRRAAEYAQMALGMGAGQGASKLLGALSPLTYALAPIKGAYSVYSTGCLLDRIYALSEAEYARHYKNYRIGDYSCSCGKCDEIQAYFVGNMEQKTIRAAANATVVGAPFEALYSFGRNVYKWSTGTKGQKREGYAKLLQEAARPQFKRVQTIRLDGTFVKDRRGQILEITRPGCRRAQAMLALIYGELELDAPEQDLGHYFETVTSLVNPQGYRRIYDAFNKR
jgi:hypothetical protein